MINTAVALLFLLFEAYEDFKHHSISLNSLVLFGAAGIIINLFCGISMKTFICGFLIGTGIILFSLISKGIIGTGDGVLFIILGIYLGNDCMMVFISSMITAAAISVIMLLLKKTRKCELPFVPCVLIAYMEVMLLEI